jgi:large exoprotein involved in heme utilization and adhesion
VGEREIKDGLFTFIGTDSTGRGGKLTINATEAISIFGGSGTGYTTGIRTSSYGKGDAGTLSVSTPALLMTGEAFIGATTLGDGNAGNIDVQVGKLTLIGRALILTNIGVGQFKDAILGAASFGAGDAGNIQIHAAETFRSRNSVVTTASTQSGGGKINLSAGQIVELVDSQITTTVQGGAGDAGNITIDPRYVILNDSQVIARAVAGNGGNINIGADVFIASPTSVVDASSQKGVSGTIDIRGVVNNLSGSLVPLPQGYLNITALSEDRCAGRLREGRVSSFVVAGREGMPLQPGGVLPSPLYDTVGKLQDVHLHPFALSVAATAAESKSGLRLRCVQNDTRANRR